MAYGVEPARAGALAQFIYVWPSRELMSRSWSWPASWHEAFQDAASRLGLAVAFYGLDGRRITRRLVSLQLSIGSVEFRLKRRGTSIFVTVSDFEASTSRGPDGPDGTRRQPGAVDGLVLGLHGSDKGCYLVVFHGQMPTVPVEMSAGQGNARLASGRRPRSHRVAGERPALTGLRVLGGRLRRDHECEQSAAFVESKKKTGNRATILKSGTLALATPPSWQSSPTSASDGTITLCWTLFWCTHKPSAQVSPIFSSHHQRHAAADRRPEIDRAPFHPAVSRYLH